MLLSFVVLLTGNDQGLSVYIQGVPKKTHHKDSNYVYLKYIYMIKIHELKKTLFTKSVQLAIIQAFTAL